MNEKKSALITVLLLSALILVFTFADFVQEDRLYSETENRILAERPDLSLKALLEGNYTQEYETWLTDQFVSRDKWITVKTWTDILTGKREINGVWLCGGGRLMEQHLPGEYSVVQETKKIALLEKLVGEWDARVMIVPTADNIQTDRLPPFALYYDERDFLGRVEAAVGPERYVDVYTALKEHGGEELYYRTDHHWTALGAYYGYSAWAEAAGEEPAPYDPESMVTVTEDFLGTLHSKVNLDLPPDTVRYFPELLEQPVTVTYDLRDVRDTCFEEAYLETKNKYGFFMDDNHGFVEIVTGCENGKTLFVIKDSYANCFIPMLFPHYERIYVTDLRYYNGRLFQFMKSREPKEGMDVLILYNCIQFLEEFAYVE